MYSDAVPCGADSRRHADGVNTLEYTVTFDESFWATACKTVRLKLSDRCFFCPVLSCLVVCNVGVLSRPNGWIEWIKMSLSMEVCLGPGQIVLHGDSSPSKGAQQPLLHFFGHVHCGQTAGWIKIPFGTKVGLSPCHIVLDGDPAPLPP